MDGETAILIRDQIRALRKSWVWETVILPHLETTCAEHMAAAVRPGPGTPAHDEARYRLDELHRFQRFLESIERNAAEIASETPPDLRDTLDPETRDS